MLLANFRAANTGVLRQTKLCCLAETLLQWKRCMLLLDLTDDDDLAVAIVKRLDAIAEEYG